MVDRTDDDVAAGGQRRKDERQDERSHRAIIGKRSLVGESPTPAPSAKFS
jgi:hypothetical protein